MKSFLVILAICSSPTGSAPICTPSETEATLYTYERFVDCIRDREYFRASEGVVAECTGQAWVPPHLVKG